MPDGPVFFGASACSQAAKLVGCRLRGDDRRREALVGAAHARAQGGQRFALLLERTDAPNPQVARVRAREVGSRRLQQRRDRLQARRQVAGLRRRERRRLFEHRPRPDRIVVELDGAVDHRALLRGRVGLFGDEIRVVRGIARERQEHAEVVVHAVHLRAHQVVIHLLRHRPTRPVDCGQARLECPEPLQPLGVGRRRVVGNATGQPGRLLERAPLLEEREQLVVSPGLGLARQNRRQDERHGNRNSDRGHRVVSRR